MFAAIEESCKHMKYSILSHRVRVEKLSFFIYYIVAKATITHRMNESNALTVSNQSVNRNQFNRIQFNAIQCTDHSYSYSHSHSYSTTRSTHRSTALTLIVRFLSGSISFGTLGIL